LNPLAAALALFPGRVEEIDRTLFLFINDRLRHAWLDPLMTFVTRKWNFLIPLTFVAWYLLVMGGRRGRAIVTAAILLVVFTDAGATALRSHFQRVRPCMAVPGMHLLVGCSDSFSFPSNHATNAFALAAFLAVFYRKLTIPLLATAALVAYSRIYVGVHYPADVVAGACFGGSVGLACGAISWWWLHRGGKTTDVSEQTTD